MVEHVYEYLEYKKRQGCRPRTLVNHRFCLNVFLTFIQEEYPDITEIADITRPVVVTYEKHLMTRIDGRGTVLSRDRRSRYLSVVKNFFRFYKKKRSYFIIPRWVLPCLSGSILSLKTF